MEKYIYCIVCTSKTPSGFKALVDYGNSDSLPNYERLLNENGNEFFNSNIAILNFMGNKGWELLNIEKSNPSTTDYTFKK
jgi:hypothetical protein